MLEPSMYSPELTWDSDDNFNSNFDTPEQVYYPVQYIYPGCPAKECFASDFLFLDWNCSEKPVNIELWDMNVNASSTNGEKNDSENKNANKNKSRKRGKRRSTNSSRLVTDPTVTNDLVPSDLKSPAPLLSANQIVPKNAVESEYYALPAPSELPRDFLESPPMENSVASTNDLSNNAVLNDDNILDFDEYLLNYQKENDVTFQCLGDPTLLSDVVDALYAISPKESSELLDSLVANVKNLQEDSSNVNVDDVHIGMCEEVIYSSYSDDSCDMPASPSKIINDPSQNDEEKDNVKIFKHLSDHDYSTMKLASLQVSPTKQSIAPTTEKEITPVNLKYENTESVDIKEKKGGYENAESVETKEKEGERKRKLTTENYKNRKSSVFSPKKKKKLESALSTATSSENDVTEIKKVEDCKASKTNNVEFLPDLIITTKKEKKIRTCQQSSTVTQSANSTLVSSSSRKSTDLPLQSANSTLVSSSSRKSTDLPLQIKRTEKPVKIIDLPMQTEKTQKSVKITDLSIQTKKIEKPMEITDLPMQAKKTQKSMKITDLPIQTKKTEKSVEITDLPMQTKKTEKPMEITGVALTKLKIMSSLELVPSTVGLNSKPTSCKNFDLNSKSVSEPSVMISKTDLNSSSGCPKPVPNITSIIPKMVSVVAKPYEKLDSGKVGTYLTSTSVASSDAIECTSSKVPKFEKLKDEVIETTSLQENSSSIKKISLAEYKMRKKETRTVRTVNIAEPEQTSHLEYSVPISNTANVNAKSVPELLEENPTKSSSNSEQMIQLPSAAENSVHMNLHDSKVPQKNVDITKSAAENQVPMSANEVLPQNVAVSPKSFNTEQHAVSNVTKIPNMKISSTKDEVSVIPSKNASNFQVISREKHAYRLHKICLRERNENAISRTNNCSPKSEIMTSGSISAVKQDSCKPKVESMANRSANMGRQGSTSTSSTTFSPAESSSGVSSYRNSSSVSSLCGSPFGLLDDKSNETIKSLKQSPFALNMDLLRGNDSKDIHRERKRKRSYRERSKSSEKRYSHKESIHKKYKSSYTSSDITEKHKRSRYYSTSSSSSTSTSDSSSADYKFSERSMSPHTYKQYKRMSEYHEMPSHATYYTNIPPVYYPKPNWPVGYVYYPPYPHVMDIPYYQNRQYSRSIEENYDILYAEQRRMLYNVDPRYTIPPLRQRLNEFGTTRRRDEKKMKK